MDMEKSRPTPLAKAGLIAGVSLFLGLLFDYFFYGKTLGLAFPLYVILVVTGLFAISAFFRQKISKQAVWFLIPLMSFSAMVFVRSSGLLTFLNVVSSLVLLLVIAEISFGKKITNFLLANYVEIFFLPFRFFGPLGKSIADLSSLRRVGKNKKVLLKVLRGVLIATPVLFVFILLFSSADLVFQKHLSDLVDINIKEETILRLALVLFATLVYIGAYSYIFRKTEDAVASQQDNKPCTIGRIENSILLGSINVLFLIFVIIQLTYLFGGGSNISEQGFTYAEYARKGFFELIAIAVISLLLLLITEKRVEKKETGHALGFKILSSALIVQVILIMISALTRLSLYEEAYGLTTLRLYSHAFIILLAVIFCLLLYKIYKDKRENTFAFRVAVSVVVFLVTMNLLNPDAFMARQNIKHFATTGKLDIYYLDELSADAVPEIVKLLDPPQKTVDTERVGYDLYRRAEHLGYPQLSKWQSLNISRIKAEKILNSKIQELEQYAEKNLRSEIQELEQHK